MFPTRQNRFALAEFHKIMSNSENKEFIIDRMLESMRNNQPYEIKRALIERAYSNSYFTYEKSPRTYPKRADFLNYHSLIIEKLLLQRNFDALRERAMELKYLGVKDRHSLSPHSNWGLGALEISLKLFDAFLSEDQLADALKVKEDFDLSDDIVRPKLAKFYFKNGENNLQIILDNEKSTAFIPSGDQLHPVLLNIFEVIPIMILKMG